LPEIVQDPNPEARAETQRVCQGLLQVCRALDGDRQPGFRKIDGLLEKGRAPEALRLWVRGVFYTDYAWDARGSGFAEEVTDEGRRLLKERLRAAEAALTKAWQLDPSTARVAAAMITVAMGLGFPRADMETWFRRAMQADADCYPACAAKLLYLEPK